MIRAGQGCKGRDWRWARLGKGSGILPLLLLTGILGACSNGSGSDSPVPSDPETPPPTSPNPPPTTPPPTTPPSTEAGLTARPNNTSCLAPADPGGEATGVALEEPFPDLAPIDFPLGLFQLPNDDSQFYVMEREGRIFRFANDPAVETLTPVLDISSRVDTFNFEGGLLGLAFHPNVASNGQVFLSYTTNSPSRSVVSRFQMNSDGSINGASEVVLLQLAQPAGNHNGGHIEFGPDGYLYIGFGDGGGGNSGASQDPTNFYGAILRIDVNTTSAGKGYGIPASNPFASGTGGAPEVYAWGLRNPWRWSFDANTGTLWAADVGQSSWEEVDHIESGGNYGWPVMEASQCSSCNPNDYKLPIHEYPRSVGSSITGGYVYRGSAIPSLVGDYVFGDYGSRRVWTLEQNGGSYQRTEIGSTGDGIVSFARDNDGEIYVLMSYSSTPILKLVPTSSGGTSAIPDRLSQSGCFNASNPREPAGGLIPYSVITPLWSDGADKERFIALPNNEAIDVNASGDFIFPVGTVLAKHFTANNTYIETRLYMHHATGWAGYSYEWNASQDDAILLAGAKDANVAGLNWHFPSGAECQQCHTSVKNFALGPEVAQMNHDFAYASTGRTANQIDTFMAIDLFTSDPSESLQSQSHYSIDDTTATLEQRAKSYLHANCAQCHQPSGPGNSNMDLRFDTALENMGVCDVVPANNLGIADARLLAPANADASMIVARMERLDSSRMPPLASHVVDTEAVMVIRDWINSVGQCP